VKLINIKKKILKIEHFRKEKEFEETMDHLQSDIDSLENERGALREKLKVHSSKKSDLKTTTALDITASSPYIAQELVLLKKALNDEREERMKLQAKDFEKVLKSLKPLYVPKVKDERLNALDDELRKVKYVSFELISSNFLQFTKLLIRKW
jgi:dynactin 1